MRIPDSPRATQMAYDNALYVRRPTTAHPVTTWDDVRHTLSDKDVAIEMICTSELSDNGDEKNVYAALILRNDYDAPRLVVLGETEKIEREWENVIHTDTALINRHYALYNSDLFNILWRPIMPFLHEGDHIYYVPTGVLGRINSQALADEGKRLSDRFTMHQLTTTAQISAKKATSSQPAFRNAVIYGGITYDVPDEEMLAAAKSYCHDEKETQLLATRSAYSRGASLQLSPLPGTGEEARQIGDILIDKGLSVTIYEGTQANEESVKALSGHSPEILHIGTHGFLLNTTNDISTHQRFLESLATKEQPNISPMNFSGLMFAGADAAWSGEKIPEGVEDGILTSSELSQLDLSNTRIAVLSACETALGHTDWAMGDFGLKRALKQAGAGTLIMSLWEVPDEATRLLMTTYYKYLANGSDCYKALLQAQDTVRKRFPQPYYWASFVIID